MIAKCIAILAVVAQINASTCGCGSSSVVLPSSGCYSQPAVLVSSDSFSGANTRNLVAKGKYPVALSNCGPVSNAQIPVTTSHITAPVQEKPIVRLPAEIPAPRTICHTCTCYKTIVKPRVHQQLITVPTVQRYIETLHKPVVENVQYEALPVNCGGVGSSSCGMIPVGCGSVCGSSTQTIQVPSCEISCAQPVQVPVVQSLSAPCVQRVEIPQTVSMGCSSPCTC